MGSPFNRLALPLLAAALALPATAATAASPVAPATAERPTIAAVAAVDPAPRSAGFLPGEPVGVAGTFGVLDASGTAVAGAATSFALVVDAPSGERRGPFGPFRTDDDGVFDVTLPTEATADLAPATYALRAVDVRSDAQGEDEITLGPLTVASADGPPVATASFVSSTGWVKPGETYPFRVLVDNAAATAADGGTVTVPAPPSTTFLGLERLQDSGAATIDADGSITWTVGEVAAATDAGPTRKTLVVEAVAASLAEDDRVVWKDLSATATQVIDGRTVTTSTTHGPKVIPPAGGYETARYGDKPYAIVQVDFNDRSHDDEHTGASLDRVVNDPAFQGSTFNLYQEMSFGQLYPDGLIPAADLATADWEYEPGFDFTTRPTTTQNTCRGITYADTPQVLGSPLYPERVVDGWYQLPGNTEYYGGDYPAFTLGVGSSIDSACGQTGKGVYDAAVVADPEIDYNDFDADKDGVVDFFMMLFTGLGGNGDSQLNGLPPYDNIWPHSSSLEMQYKDDETGLRGYVTDDQLFSLTGVPQCWVDDRYLVSDDCASAGGTGDDALPTFVRVGPYNVNPESSFDSASVISHEYGHHLGLPDFYDSGAELYGSFNLMAADFSQHMTIFGKQDLGWVVPEVLQPGETRTVEDWREIKSDTGAIRWETPDGEPYTLSAGEGDQNIHNGESYAVKLPSRILIDPDKVAEQASGEYVWYSGRGNDFGCSPTGAHNFDIFLPELRDVPEGSDIELSFRSSFDIEWDWDYGFVLSSGDGASYTSVASEAGYTTSKAYNPNGAQCLDELDNGLTGLSGSYEAGTETIDRNAAAPNYDTGSPFVDDAYDISSLAGADSPTVRFSYFTDAAFDRPGWFIDDVVVTVDGEEIYASDFESGEPDAGREFPGGCDPDGFDVAVSCTAGWTLVSAKAGSAADHGYFLELRDRALFDFEGYGQSERGTPSWDPGLLIEYTDEAHGYGNNGVPAPPAQMYIDSQPVPGEDCGGRSPAPNCDDMSFTSADGDSRFSDVGFVNSFSSDETDSGEWEFDFGCLSTEVVSMSGHDTRQVEPDLTADVRITAGDGCVSFDALDVATANAAPTARAQAKPAEANLDEDIIFDGSGTTDDLQPADELDYAWDLGDGATAEGQAVRHAYGEAGEYTVTLTVTDAQGASSTDRLTVTVAGAGPGVTPPDLATPLPTTGGGLAVLGISLLGAGFGFQRLRRV